MEFVCIGIGVTGRADDHVTHPGDRCVGCRTEVPADVRAEYVGVRHGLRLLPHPRQAQAAPVRPLAFNYFSAGIDDPLLTVAKTADWLQVTQQTVHNSNNRRELAVVRIRSRRVWVRHSSTRF